MRVKSKKGLRDVVDAATGYEVKDSTLTPLSPEGYSKYIRPEYILDASYQFGDIPIDGLNALTKLFEEVSKQ